MTIVFCPTPLASGGWMYSGLDGCSRQVPSFVLSY